MKLRKTLSALLAAAVMCGMLSITAMADEEPAADAAPETVATVDYTVKAGDTLGKISANFYGTNAQRNALYQFNAEAFKATKGKLVPDMVLKIPEKLGKDTMLPRPVAGEGETLYEIKYGDTLGKIAKATYGNTNDYKLIYERNKERLESAAMIYEGQVIVLPVKPAPVEPAPVEPAPVDPAPVEPAQPAGPDLAEGEVAYTVVKGDNLSKIAKATYGAAKDWKLIYDRNKDIIGKNPNMIYPGQVIVLPVKPAPAPAPAEGADVG